jgi:fatty-acyl-CoA synthase
MNEDIKVLGEIFEPAVKKCPDKLALKMGGVEYTYMQLKDEVLKLKNHLLSLGLKKGDTFAVCGENRPEWAVAYLAIARAGLIVVPLDRLLSEAEILHILRQSDATGAIVSENYVDKIEELKTELSNFDHIILMNKYEEIKKIE